MLTVPTNKRHVRWWTFEVLSLDARRVAFDVSDACVPWAWESQYLWGGRWCWWKKRRTKQTLNKKNSVDGIGRIASDSNRVVTVAIARVTSRELPKPIMKVSQNALRNGLEVPGDMSVGENSWYENFEQVEKDRNSLLEEVNTYKVDKDECEKILIEMEVAMITITWSLVDVKESMNCFYIKKGLYMKRKEWLPLHPTQETTGDGQVMYKLLKNISPLYLRFVFKVEKTILKYFSREFSELVQFVSELRENRKWRYEEVETMEVYRENWTTFAPLILFIKCKLYTQYMPSVESADQCLQKKCNIKQVDIGWLHYFRQASMCCRCWSLFERKDSWKGTWSIHWLTAKVPEDVGQRTRFFKVLDMTACSHGKVKSMQKGWGEMKCRLR